MKKVGEKGYSENIKVIIDIKDTNPVFSIDDKYVENYTTCSKYLDKLLTIYHASRYEKLKYLVIPSALVTIVNSLKINISMTLIGVIMGEFLVSKAGIGYLIVYGSQVFNLTLVLTGIFILILISFVMYVIITIIENKIKRSYD